MLYQPLGADHVVSIANPAAESRGVRDAKPCPFKARRDANAELLHHPILIDDLQWGDTDSASLLAEVLLTPRSRLIGQTLAEVPNAQAYFNIAFFVVPKGADSNQKELANGIFYEMLTYPVSRAEYLIGKVLFNIGVALAQAAVTIALAAWLLGLMLAVAAAIVTVTLVNTHMFGPHQHVESYLEALRQGAGPRK